ncbi:MAG: DUF4198 domain-containing protein [Desulfosudaceae bacterium]
MKQALWMALIILLTGVQMGYAHHLWVFEENGRYVAARGHIGERLDAYDPSCVTQISARSTDGKALSINRTNEKERVVFTTKEKPAMVAVTSAWGDRVNTTRGKKLMNRKEAEAKGLTVISAFSSTQYSKTLFAPAKISTQSLGLKFELVPLADPMALTPGESIAFKLLFDGRPLAGIPIATNHDQETQTDEDGVARLTFEKSGRQLLYATHQIPAGKDSGLDFLKFMTFLTFEGKE